jgi:hypothetical protein
MFAGRETRVKAPRVNQGADSLLDLARFRDHIETVDAGVTAVWAHHRKEDV